MRKLRILLVTGVISCWISGIFAQSSMVITENFDGNTNTFTSSPASAWKIGTDYYANSHNSIRGIVPNMIGDETTLTSPIYDFSNYTYVLLRFKHICKISPQDKVTFEYRIGGQGWQPLPASTYKWKTINYNTTGFNADSYVEWQVNDSTATPAQWWWKEEMFDLGFEVKNENVVQFRFVLKHGNTPGTQISYGWLIDDFEIIADTQEIRLPVVEFLSPLVRGNVSNVGPWKINAKVKTQIQADTIETPWLKYTATNSQGTVKDSVLMTMVSGDSLWKAIIPAFTVGTEVFYSITGKDITGNMTTEISDYVIVKPNHHYGDTSIALISIDSPIRGLTMGGVTTPVTVTIRNKGDSALTSATIYWSINGVITSYPWTGNLPWDFEQQITIGKYLPRMEEYDTVVIWVSMPNGIGDIVLTDDTLTIIIYGCAADISGTIIIGNSGLFLNLQQMLDFFNDCPPNGNIILALEDGIYAENCDLSNISDIMGNNTLTITSLTNNADNVIFRPSSGVGITLANSNNLVIKNITVDAATSGTYAIQFIGACSNVVIRDSKLLVNQTGTTAATRYAPIYKAISTDISDSIFIINNLLDGGYYGIYFYGAANSYAYTTHVVFDSNTLSNQYYYGTYFYFVDFTSCSYNLFLGGTTNRIYWYALYMVSSNAPIIGNRIIQRSNAITSPFGITVQQFNYYNTSDTGLIVNNEIILNSTSAYPGIEASQNIKAKILHNSIYIAGSNAARGIQINNTANNYIVIKNNNIVMESINAYPIYLESTANLSLYDIDYNNIYAPTFVGYAGDAKENITAWQQTITTDLHSVSVRPSFIDSSAHLKIVDYLPLYTSVLSEASVDIENIYRTGNLTAMGCYHGFMPYTVNGALGNISGFRTGGVFGQQDVLEIQLFNTGSTTLTTAALNWSLNGVTQSAIPITWSGSLLSKQNTLVTLGTINYTQIGNNVIRVWIENLGSLQDEDSKDDTATISGYICQNALSGSYTIGNGGTFSSWNAAIEQVRFCGISGNIIFEFLPDEYTMNLDLSSNSSLFGNYTLTITSSTHNAEDVTLKTTSSGILLNNSNHITIEAISIDATAGIKAIEFTGTCSNIVINNCIILANSTATNASFAGIYRETTSSIISDLMIKNCTIKGGYYGIYLNGWSTNYCQNITIDSNIISEQYYYGMSLSNVNLNSVSYNYITPRSSNEWERWYGLYFYRARNGGNIIGNRIRANNPGINNTLYGMYTNYIDSALVANNEIYINSTAFTTYGMYCDFSNGVDYLHNTVLLTGTGDDLMAARIYVSTNASYYATYRNNIFIANGGTTSYAVYLSAAPNVNFSLYNYIDCNNYYSSGDLGYAGNAKKDLAAWKASVYTDSNSVNILPNFVDIANNLEFSNYISLYCNLIPAVGRDIQNSNRRNSTVMGCYEEPLKNTNGALVEISGLRERAILAGETDSIKVVFANRGNSVLNAVNLGWSINGVIQPSKDFPFTTPLAITQLDTIDFGIITYSAGNYEVKVWINHFNGGALLDEFSLNDTISASTFVCANTITGIIPVSDTSYFSTITSAIQAVSICGVGDITLLLDSGVYEENCDFSDVNRYLRGNTLTVISKTGNADDVIIKPVSGAGITLSKTHNLILKSITVNVTSGTDPAILFIDACTNIIVRDCKLLANPTTIHPLSAAVYKENIETVDSIFFINNLMDGGYYGVVFYGGASEVTLGTNIVFDSNTISNQYIGLALTMADFISCSYNTILSRITNIGNQWIALYLTIANGPVIGNRIIQRNTNITSPYGINLIMYNFYTATPQSRGLIANNEIILNMNASGTYGGISANNSRAEILHNSIYISGTGNAKGIYIPNSANNNLMIKNNNIVLTSSTAYPVYFSATGNLNLYDMDYNNLYAPQYVGYYGGDITTMGTWQQTIPTEQHSVCLYSNFIDSSVSLALSDYTGLMCPSLQGVGNDINGVVRTPVTAMGAYGSNVPLDIEIQNIVCDTTVLYPQTVPVKIEIQNGGSAMNINNAMFGWSVNGIVQTSYSWTASTPLGIGDNIEIPIGLFNPVERTNIFDIVVWIESVNGTKDSISWNDTARASVKIFFTGKNLRIVSMERLVPDNELCTEDYVPLTIQVQNTGSLDYDFAINPVMFRIRVTNPIAYRLDTVISTGEIKSGEIAALKLTDVFPIIVAGQYDISVWMDSINEIVYDDSLASSYISNRVYVPIDEDFSNAIPSIFSLQSNSTFVWDTISQGTGTDTAIIPQFGTGMLTFKGSPGSMTVLSTYQLDLSRTVQPALSFWYFHDTIPCEDYTDVRITIDGGTTYNTLFSLTKYNPVYGWQQYSMDLPGYAVNQCVILIFEAMEKSRSGNVTQYIDRILITAKQDIAITEILTSPFAACDLQNKEVKVVLSNLTDPVLDFTTTPTTLTLEILETGQTYTHLLDSGSLGRFASDTITIATGVNFTKGTYTLKAYFTSVLDVDRQNDTLVTSIVINPELSVSVYPESSPANCLTGELVVNPTITLYNTGNMDLSNIDMILQVDTGENITAVYTLFKETYTSTILAGDTATYMFNSSYSVPWNARYDVRTYIYLSCDSALANSTNMVQECVDIKDLRILSIDNPSATVTKDAVGSSIQVTVTLNNRSDGDIFTDIPINVRITNSQGIEQETFMEPQTIGASATVSHTFSRSYTVPNDTVYYLSVFVNSQDNYRDNDTMTTKRYTESVGIETLKSIGGFTLYQNIPNPANNRTRIDYSIPERGEVIFHVHSVSGQLLYSQNIEAASGKQSLELNTSTFAAGIYFYSIEYKGQRLVKRMMISD